MTCPKTANHSLSHSPVETMGAQEKIGPGSVGALFVRGLAELVRSSTDA